MVHASPDFNLPNYPASRQEKFQEFLRRPGYFVSFREYQVYDQKNGFRSSEKTLWAANRHRTSHGCPTNLWVVFFAYLVQLHYGNEAGFRRNLRYADIFEIFFLTSCPKIRSHHNWQPRRARFIVERINRSKSFKKGSVIKHSCLNVMRARFTKQKAEPFFTFPSGLHCRFRSCRTDFSYAISSRRRRHPIRRKGKS